ncbi:unnamed protein product [Clavelina lepadiformis]|uniref:Uncharacterized protein n=1 Tax=Clavelina lepadiformis TaxID=159417 RepID=A0ABP0F9G6_CLALP
MDTNNRKFAHDRRMPVGFNAQKFPIMSNGCVGFMERSSLDCLREGRWKRVSRLPSDPLPLAPANPGPSRPWMSLPARRNPHDLLPATPGSRRNDPLPPPPVYSSSSSD